MSACLLDDFSFFYMKASVWRTLMGIGFKLHHFAEPKSPTPAFELVIPSRLSTGGGSFKLAFYVPESYFNEESDYRFPVVVNYHGGGFTLGTETDDARWAAAVNKQTNAIVVSVAYRLAPEYTFSVGVEDAADAVIYLAAHAEELSLDPHKIALSGFSSGANFSFAVPLLIHDLKTGADKRILRDNSTGRAGRRQLDTQFYSSASSLVRSSSSIALAQSYPTVTSYTPPNPYFARPRGASNSVVKLPSLEPTALETAQTLPDFTIVAIVSFYPPVDFRQSREAKRLTNPRPDKNLPLTLTALFDEAYILRSGCDLADPYLSPAAASDEFLKAAYPQNIVLYTCEYDMLNAEGVLFGERLQEGGIGKTVYGGLIKGVGHAFDKKPNPISFPKEADLSYAESCKILNKVFGRGDLAAERTDSEIDLTVLPYDGSEVDELIGLDSSAAEASEQREDNKPIELPERKSL